jgi:cytosine/adenosine deaminase-related metal-dependent hydrolase
MTDVLIRGVRLWGRSGVVDVALREGFIAAIGAGLPDSDGGVDIDGSGCLLLPGFVDAHAHLDKTLWGTPWQPNQAGPTLWDKINHERALLARLGLAPERQSARILRRMIACGTTHCRSHVDIGPDIGLRHFHGVLAMREAHRDWIDLQLVAFPQTGVMVRPGTLELLEQAVREGAEVLGGLDPMGIDHDPKGQLDGLFAIAGRHGCELDIHLHDAGALGAATFEMIAERTRALGMKGRVAVSHAFCLGQLEPARLEQLITLLLDNDIAIMSHAPSGPTPFPPLRLLHERGVRLFTGSDGVRDAWGPLNNGDLLERAYLIAYRSGFRDDPGIELALTMATFGGARLMGAQRYGLEVGCAADLVLVEAETAAEAVVLHPPRRAVFKRGRLVAQDGRCLLPPAG